jgi:hypothetical protein
MTSATSSFPSQKDIAARFSPATSAKRGRTGSGAAGSAGGPSSGCCRGRRRGVGGAAAGGGAACGRAAGGVAGVGGAGVGSESRIQTTSRQDRKDF